MYVIVDNLRTPKNTFIVTSKWATILILIVPKKIPILLHFDNIKCYLQSYHKLECFFFVFFPSFSFSLLTREYIYFYPTLSQLWNIHTFTLAKAAYNKHKNNMLSAPCPENSWFLSHSILSVWCLLFFFLSRVFLRACGWPNKTYSDTNIGCIHAYEKWKWNFTLKNAKQQLLSCVNILKIFSVTLFCLRHDDDNVD